MQIGRPAFSVVASGGKLTVTPVEKPPRRNLLLHTQLRKEAGVGIEPTYGAFAEPGLTTWLPRRGKGITNTR